MGVCGLIVSRNQQECAQALKKYGYRGCTYLIDGLAQPIDVMKNRRQRLK